MKKGSVFIVALIGLTIGCNPRPELSAQFDFSSLAPFWNLAEQLSKDSMPPATLWDSLFETPGYQTLTAMEFPKEWIRNYMLRGIKPSEQPVYSDWVSKGYWDTIFCHHMREAASRRADIEAFVKIMQSGDIATEALTHLKSFWPSADTLHTLPPISFIIFNRDARGYDPVLIDILFASDLYNQGQLDELIAHEAHHYYRYQILTFQYPPEDQPDYTVIHMLNQVHMEGLADQIDKPGTTATFFRNGTEYFIGT